MSNAKFPDFVRSTEYRRELGLKRKRAIQKMYSDIAKETENKINAIQRAGKWTGTTVLQMKQLRDLQKSIDDSLKNISAQIEKDIVSDMKKVAEVTCSDVAGMMKRIGVNVGAAYAHVPELAVKNIVSGNLYGQRWNFSKAVWGDYRKASGDLAQIVAKGLAQNRPIYDIAKDLEKYVNPNVRKDFDWGKRYPGSKKTVDYNALRLAQTMSTHAHQQAVIIANRDNPLFDGVVWHAHGNSRTCSLCEQRNGQIFPFDKCPMDHPMGECTLSPHMKTDSRTAAERIGDWIGGKSEDPELDKFAETLGYTDKSQMAVKPVKSAASPGVSANNAAEKLAQMQKASDELGKAVKDFGKSVDGFENAVGKLQNAAKGLTSGGNGGIINTGRGNGVVKGSYPDNPAVEIIGADTSNPNAFVLRYALDNGFRESKIERMVYVRSDGKAFVKDGFEYGIGTASIADQLQDAVTLHCHPDYLDMPGGSFSISQGDDLFDMFAQKTKMDFVMDSKHVYGMKVDWSKIKDEDELAEMIKKATNRFNETHTTDYIYDDKKHEICKMLSKMYPKIFDYKWR